MRVSAGSEHEHVREDLPCEQALRDEAQPEIPALAVAVVAPAPDPLVLQRLVHREAVEQDEKRDEDRVDKRRRCMSTLSRGANLQRNGDPRYDAGDAAEHERKPARPRTV